jgi:hypothetical protein
VSEGVADVEESLGVLENIRGCPVKMPRRSSGWVTVTNRAEFEELDAPGSAEGGRAARKPAGFRWRLGAFDSVEEPGRFDMGFLEVARKKSRQVKKEIDVARRLKNR